MRKTVAFDLDGTLANIDHRLHYVQRPKPDWRAFYAACVADTPNQWCVDLMVAMGQTGHDVIVVSARSKEVERETQEWMGKIDWQGIRVEVYMLREGPKDQTKDEILKKAWLDKYGKERILFVVDDRQRVVDMWRAQGLTCLQCAAWAEYKRPPKQGVRSLPGSKGCCIHPMTYHNESGCTGDFVHCPCKATLASLMIKGA